MSIFYSSVMLYTSEACMALCFFMGLAFLVNRLSSSLGRFCAYRVTDRLLVRFCWFQIAFVAVWSIAFKGVLYTSLLPWYSHDLMAKGQSLGIAIPAELLMLLVVLVGLARLVRQAGCRDL